MNDNAKPNNEPTAPKDCPETITIAEFNAHLKAHQLLEERLQTNQTSIPVSIEGPGGWSVKGRGPYLIAIIGMLLAALFGWLLAGK